LADFERGLVIVARKIYMRKDQVLRQLTDRHPTNRTKESLRLQKYRPIENYKEYE